MTLDERSARIRQVVAEAKRERARVVRLILGAVFSLPYRAWPGVAHSAARRRAPPNHGLPANHNPAFGK